MALGRDDRYRNVCNDVAPELCFGGVCAEHFDRSFQFDLMLVNAYVKRLDDCFKTPAGCGFRVVGFGVRLEGTSSTDEFSL